MSYLVNTKQTHRIYLKDAYSAPMMNAAGTLEEVWYPPFDDSDHWVEIADQLSDYDRKQIQTRAESVAFQQDGPGVGVRMSSTNYERGMLTLFSKVIKDWSLTYDDGSDRAEMKLPVNEDTFRKLGSLSKWLEDAIWAHYLHQDLTPQQLKNFARVPSPFTSAALPFPTPSTTSSSPNGSVPTPIESVATRVETSSTPGF